jgi:hypothetical protein
MDCGWGNPASRYADVQSYLGRYARPAENSRKENMKKLSKELIKHYKKLRKHYEDKDVVRS